MYFNIFPALLLSLVALAGAQTVSTSTVTATETSTSVVDITSVLTTTKTSTKSFTTTTGTSSLTCLNTDFTAVRPVTTVTVTEIATSTNIVTQTETASTTTTLTIGAVATSIVSNGLQYRRYAHNFNAEQANNAFTSSFFKGLRPVLASGVLQSLTFGPTGTGNYQLPDGSPAFSPTQAAIVFHGFFIAKETGEYRFSTNKDSIDNWGYLWTGHQAYSDWDDTNAAYKASRTLPGPFIGGTTAVNLVQGDAIPLTFLWANGGNSGSSDFGVTAPTLGFTKNTTGYFVQACSPGIFP